MSYVLNYVASPVRNYVSSLLVSALSKYIIGIEVNSLGILSQELNLQNVELNLTSLEADLGLQFPVVIKSSFAKSLKIVIPWTSLFSLPIGIYVDNLDIEIRDKTVEEKKQTTPSESPNGSGNTEDSTSPRTMWGDSYLKRIMANISVRVDNVIIRYTHENIHTVITSKYIEVMSSGPEDNWEYNWQEPRGSKGSIFKSINVGDFSISIDSMQHRTPRHSMFDLSNSISKEKEATVEMDEDRERIFYYPFISNLSIHIRCMISLWEGVVGATLSGTSSDNASTESSGWNFFGLLSEKEVDEIDEYHLHITQESDQDNHSTYYHIHNMQTTYDISYYTNLIDIHVDDDFTINLNTFQLNALISLLNVFLNTEDSVLPTASDEMMEVDTVAEDQPSNDHLPSLESRAKEIHSESPMIRKFNVNSISMYIGMMHFTYFMPRHLLPSSYQVAADKSIPVVGEGKEEKKDILLSSYAVPKSMMKPAMEVSIGGIEAVGNFYDNQFYSADCLFIVQDLSVNILDKTLIRWNSPLQTNKRRDVNHICMFGEKPFAGNLAEHTEKMKKENALVLRFKKYSTLYHDYMLFKHSLYNEIIPTGCIELFCNSLHISKEVMVIPILSAILQNILPIRTPHQSDTPVGDPSHSDYFVQLGVSDFSLSYAVGVSSNPLISPSSSLLGVSLKSMEILYFNNLSCPLCPVASSEVVLSIDMNSLGIRSNYRSLVTLDSFRIHFLNNRIELSGSVSCNKGAIQIDAESTSIWLAAGKELCRLINIPFPLPSVNFTPTLHFNILNLFGHTAILKIDNVITDKSAIHAKIVLQLCSLLLDEKSLFSYPVSTSLDHVSNAFEMMIDNSEKEKRITCTSSAMYIDLFSIVTLLNNILSWMQDIKGPSRESVPNETETKGSGSPFVLFDIDIRELLHSLTMVNIFSYPIQIVLSEKIQFFTPTVTITNSTSQSREITMILKNLRMLHENHSVIELEDMVMILDFINYTVHCSSQTLAMSLCPSFIQSLLCVSSIYEDFLSVLYADVKSLDESLEQTEVVTESSIFLRSSVDRMSFDKNHMLRRHSSCSREDVVEQSEERKRIIAQFRLSYVLERATVELTDNAHPLLVAHLKKCSFYTDDEEIQVGCDQIQLSQDEDHYVLLESASQAFSLVCNTKDYFQCSISLSSFMVHLSSDRIDHLFQGLISFLPSEASSSASSQTDESKHIFILVTIHQSAVNCYYSASSFYQLKLIQMRVQFDRLTTHSDLLSFQLQNFFITDSSSRLLLTDLSCQLDLEWMYYRTGNVLSVQLLLPQIDASVHIEDIEHCLLLFHHYGQIFGHFSGEPTKVEESSTDLRLKLQLNDLHFELCKPKHCLTVALSSFNLSLQTTPLEASERLLALGSLCCELDGMKVLKVATLSFEDNMESLCLCVDCEVREKGRHEWFYVYLGDVYCVVTPDLVDLCVLSFVNLPATAASFRSISEERPNQQAPTDVVQPSQSSLKYGISVSTQSMQVRLMIPNQTALLVAYYSLSAMVSTASAHFELQRACVLLDKDECHVDADVYSPNPAYFAPVVDECKVVVTADMSSGTSPSRVTLDVQDVIVTVDDHLINRLSLLISTYYPLIDQIRSKSIDMSVLSSDSYDSFSLTSNESLGEGPLPKSFDLSNFHILLQDTWPEEGELIVFPSESVESNELMVFPPLDYYQIINGGIPHVLPLESVRMQKHSQQTEPHASFFSFLNPSNRAQPERSLSSVNIQFRFPSVVRIFSIVVKRFTKASIEEITGPGSASLFGDCLEFDLLAWSEINRSFQYIKSVCMPVVDESLAVSVPSYISGVGKEDVSFQMENESVSEFFEMMPPYSYSARYQIIVHLHHSSSSSMTKQAILSGVAKVVASYVSFQYFAEPSLDYYQSFSITSNMVIFKLNHTSCCDSLRSSDALQVIVTKPKLLYRLSQDCQELSLYGSISVNSVNLISLLLMPIVQKFNCYCSFTRLTANAFCLPNCLYCSLASSALDIIINTDTLLLVNHLLDGYLYAWNHPVREKNDVSDQLLCSGRRITFFNNSVYDLFVSQLFTDEAVLLPHNSSTPYSYKLATTINQDAPILRFSLASYDTDHDSPIAGAWSKGINIHSFSQDKEESIKLYLERRGESESESCYETVYISVVNTLLQVTVTIFSPIRLLSMLATPLEVQMRDNKRISNPVTPATISVRHYLQYIHDPSNRSTKPIYYSPFPFSMVNHFDYYDKDREENQNHVYIRLRNKTTGIWGNWLRLPDVYFGQSYRLCRIHIPIDSENNYNYCYLVNRYSEELKANIVELLPAMMFLNNTQDNLTFKNYINEGRINRGETERIDYNYMLNNNVNNGLVIRPSSQPAALSTVIDVNEDGPLKDVICVDNKLCYQVTREVLYSNQSNHYQVQVISVYPLLQFINRCDTMVHMSLMIRSQSGVLHTQLCSMAAHSFGELIIAADGNDFNAVSLTSPEPDEVVEPKQSDRQGHISLALGTSTESAVWSSDMLVSLEPSSFFQVLRGDFVLVPLYNSSTHTNDCFFPIRMDRRVVNNVDTILFSPLAVLTNSLSETLLVNSCGFVRAIEPGDSYPFMTRQMDNRSDRFSFSVKGVTDAAGSWSDEVKLMGESADCILNSSPYLLHASITHPPDDADSLNTVVEFHPWTPPPFILHNHTLYNIRLAGEGSEASIILPHSRAIDFDWCVLSRAVREKYGSKIREGSPNDYWQRVQPSPHVMINAEKGKSYRVILFTQYHATSQGTFQPSVYQDSVRPWTQPLWLDKTYSRRIKVYLDGEQRSLFLYCYHLHNIHFLEIFDSVPTLLLSALFSRSLQLRHYVKSNYINPFYNGTDSERSTDSGSDSSLSYTDLSFTQSGTSGYTSQKTYQIFDTQLLSDHSEVANQILYQPPYMNESNMQVLIDIPSLSLSVYEMQNGIYKELVHCIAEEIRLTLQQGAPELFNEIVKSLPLLQLHSMTSLIAEIGKFQIDSFLSPAKPILQIPYQQSNKKSPISVSIVFNRMRDVRLPPSLLLLDISIPYMWADITDKHMFSLLTSFSSLLTLSALYRHHSPPSFPSLDVTRYSPPPRYLHLTYCRIHPIYFLLSVEFNVFVSLSFQRTPLRFRVRPLTHATGRVEDYIQSLVNWLLPSVLLQSPSFVGALDLIGNPANLVISLYQSAVNVFRNPISALRSGEGVLVAIEQATTSSIALLQTFVNSMLNSVSSISACLSRNIQRLNDDDNSISLTSLLSSGLGIISSTTQSLMRSTSTSEPVQLLRPTRNNRATVYAQLLYQWKLIDVGESLILRLTTIVDVVNISNGWINRTTIQNVLLLASDRCCYLYTTKLTDSGESTYSIAYRIPFSNIEVVSNASSDSDTVFVLYRVNRSVDITANHTPQDTKEDVRTIVQRVVECLKGEKPSTESFLLEYETKIRELCEASWCLRLMAITCKEPNKGEILVNTLRRNCSVC